ncbi:Aste57867_1262 [Aphanomyces stellatus]|uniref:Aste57867_1262 protein n=1 Tax=Aphanomyces stellatus TaxID=120398 RepID=A0A485K4X4_9STRA|nr:hypothetical protein As57867_001261 [Aphanomyces stellatus]VFT78481.1 Aste57867_1262 [Aphanomyces stellatus]
MPTFPLPANFFKCPPLNRDEKYHLQEMSRKVSSDVIENSRVTNPDMHWRLSTDDYDVQIYEGKDPAAPSGVVSWCGVTHVMATLDEVASLFVSHTTDAYKENNAILAKDLVDGAHLYSIAKHATENISLKWMAVKSPVPGVVKPRDFCYLDVQHRFEWEGHVGYVVAMTSIPLGCCPNLRHTLGLIRGHMYRAGFVFLETDRPGYLQVSQIYQTDYRGALPAWVINQGMKVRIKNVRSMDRHLREKRLGGSVFLAQEDLIPKSSRSKCFLCQKKFGALSAKTQCRKCGEVMCGGCAKTWKIHISGFETRVVVCSSCSIDAREGGIAMSVAPSAAMTETTHHPNSRDRAVSFPSTERSQDGHHHRPHHPSSREWTPTTPSTPYSNESDDEFIPPPIVLYEEDDFDDLDGYDAEGAPSLAGTFHFVGLVDRTSGLKLSSHGKGDSSTDDDSMLDDDNLSEVFAGVPPPQWRPPHVTNG